MWKQALAVAATVRLSPVRRQLSISAAVNYDLLHSVDENFREVCKIAPSPKKVTPPLPYSIVKGALERSDGQVLRREYGDEEISISVMRRALAIPSRSGDTKDGADDLGHDFINELFLHVSVSRPMRSNSLLFLCGLYPDAVGIHSVCLLSKLTPGLYQGRVFLELDQKLRDQFCLYLEERSVDERLFPFFQSWLYQKDHHNLMNWFSNISKFINDIKPT
ncbi:hypothetical protein Cni_G06558 [Canna indica]|uniref:Mitochondrial glycoprotein n=1 Tax=Canna indica TaxID=4628 RepID=A0AAQ3K1T8_9LILI|nr:hypothetical protein Cni_G06558 [Canna indica]